MHMEKMDINILILLPPIVYSIVYMNTISAGVTPLHAAASRGQVDCCKVILGHLTAEHDRNPSDNYGVTPLHLAAVKGHIGKAFFD